MGSRRTAKTLPMYDLAQRTFKAKEKSDHCDRVLSFRAQQRLLPVDEVIFWWGEIILFLYMMVTELVELNWSETERESERDVDTQLSHHPWLAVEFTTIHNIPAWKVIELYLEPSKEQHKKRTI